MGLVSKPPGTRGEGSMTRVGDGGILSGLYQEGEMTKLLVLLPLFLVAWAGLIVWADAWRDLAREGDAGES